MSGGKFLMRVSTLGLILSLFALVGVACVDNEPDAVTPPPADPETLVIIQPEPVGGHLRPGTAPEGYAQPVNGDYVVFGQDGISTEGDVLRYGSHNPDGAISYTEVDDAERGKILNVSKTGATGNVFFNSAIPIDLSVWSSAGAIAFDYRVNSVDPGVQLLVKINSGEIDSDWLNESVVDIPTDGVGEWQNYSIEVSDLLDNDNGILQLGIANLSMLLNVFVIEPSGVMDVDFANIRYTASICDPGYEYVPDEVIITYKDPAPVLENEDETGTIYLRGYGGYEATFVNRGLAVVSEDLASVGVDTADLEIFGGEESRNTYYVRFNDDIDSLQLVFQLRAIDRIGWVRLNYSPSTRSNYSYEPDYALDQVIITYKDPSPGLAVISEDFASVGVDTTDLEIVVGYESSNRYYVRYNAEIDPIPLSIQLETIDRIRRATPNPRLYTTEALVVSSCALFRNQ